MSKGRNFSWVYRNRFTDDLVLVMRPHRRAVERKYRVLEAHFRRAGFRPDELICVSGRSYDRSEFMAKYEYVGGLNTKGRPGKRKVGASPVLGMGYEAPTEMFDDPYQNMFEESQSEDLL